MGPRRIVKVEEDEEEIVVQFNGLMSGNEDMRSRMSSCKFLRMDQDEPVIQVGNQVFKGSLEPIMGTAVCFQESKCGTTDNRDDSAPRKTLSFISKTDKILVMKRVFLQPKNSSTTTQEGMSTVPSSAEASSSSA